MKLSALLKPKLGVADRELIRMSRTSHSICVFIAVNLFCTVYVLWRQGTWPVAWFRPLLYGIASEGFVPRFIT